jgi:hypothetical protein
MTDFSSPVGRLVQGSPIMQHQKDAETNQLLYEDGKPVMGIFMALAFPKLINGQRNAEFDAFWSVLAQTAAAAWPALFPNGFPQYVEYIKPGQPGASTHPRFSYKYQDGDGTDASGKSVATKPGFAGHHIIKFATSFPVRCFMEGKFAPHEELAKPEEIIKRGFWCRIIGETKTNGATGTQVPGIAIYPKLVSFVGRGSDGEIVSGPDAETAFGAAPVGWRPVESSPIPTGAPAVAVPTVAVPTAAGVPNVAVPAVAVPTVAVPTVAVPAVAVPSPGVPTPSAVSVPVPTPAGPQVNATLAASNITWDMLKAQGWTEDTARAAGHIV